MARAATYYVATNGNNSNPGTESQPWRTLTYAIGFGSTSPTTAGDTVLVRGGVYHEAVQLKKTFNSTKDNPTIIMAYPGETVTMDGTLPLTEWHQCTSSDAFLTDIQGVINPNYQNIYWTRIKQDMIYPPAWTGAPIDLVSTAKRPIMLIENGVRRRIARYPDQIKNFGLDIYDSTFGLNPTAAPGTFIGVGPEATNPAASTYLRDNDGFLNKPTGYWNGAWIDIFMYELNSNIARATVASYINVDNVRTATFDQQLPISGITGLPAVLSRDDVNKPPLRADAYSIVNHPSVLDTPGEFAMTTTPDSEGYYKIYLWPQYTLESDPARIINYLSSNVTYAYYGSAFHLSFSPCISYVIIDGFHIKGYSSYGIFFEGDGSQRHTGHTVQNCVIENTDGSGVKSFLSDYITVRNCEIKNAREECLEFMNGNYNVISDNILSASWETNVGCRGQANLTVLRNKMYGSVGYHGHALYLYDACNRVLVADNLMDTHVQSMALREPNNIIFYDNVIITRVGEYAFQTWTNGTGDIMFLNNVILSAGSNAIAITTSGKALAVNNVLSGIGINASGGRTYKNNLYTKINGAMSLDPSEIDGHNYTLDQLFTNASGGDYSLCTGSPLIGKGLDAYQLLSSWGITTFFPDYDFAKDRLGNSWSNPPSIGAYEYVTQTTVIYGDLSGDSALSAYDAALAARIAVGLDAYPTGDNLTKADVSGGGGVTAYDAALIAQKAVGLIVKFPVES
jgi:hypothetical protein